MREARCASRGALEPESPCTSVCVLDARGFCIGCERHIDEIVAWSQMTAQGKRALLEELPARRERRRSDPAGGPAGPGSGRRQPQP
jgi:hypothetical protein